MQVCLFELYTDGAPPYGGRNHDAYRASTEGRAWEVLGPALAATMPAALQGLTRECWALDPAARPRMQEVHARLEAAAAAVGAPEGTYGAPAAALGMT